MSRGLGAGLLLFGFWLLARWRSSEGGAGPHGRTGQMSEPTSEFRQTDRLAGDGPASAGRPRCVGEPSDRPAHRHLLRRRPLGHGPEFGQVGKALGGLGAIVALQAAAWLIRRGRIAEREYAERTITRAPPPRKLAGLRSSASPPSRSARSATASP
jgi:hypothetical protein